MNAQKIISVLPSQHSEKPYAQRQNPFGLVTSSDERRKPINAGLSSLFVWQKGFRPVFTSVLVVPASGYFIFSSVISVAPQLWCNCLTAVVQLPHNCGATAPQLWGNGNIPCKNKKKHNEMGFPSCGMDSKQMRKKTPQWDGKHCGGIYEALVTNLTKPYESFS